MANIFKQNLDVTQNPNRNNFDLTHKVHGTYKMGVLYPFLCKPVVPSDSFRIDTACGFQFMPMPFPTQSNIRCIFHYFYVRNKNIWSNWENWLQGLEEHTPPYIDQPITFYKTGSLADYLDIPTTLVGKNLDRRVFDPSTFGSFAGEGSDTPINYAQINADDAISVATGYTFNSTGNNPLFRFAGSVNNLVFVDKQYRSFVSIGLESSVHDRIAGAKLYLLSAATDPSLDVYESATTLTNITLVADCGNLQVSPQPDNKLLFTITGNDNIISKLNEEISGYDGNENLFLAIRLVTNRSMADSFFTGVNSAIDLEVESPSDVADISQGISSPYYHTGSDDDGDSVKISALPFRAYESIYRCYYANSVIQPLEINGVKKYNRYNTNLEDGADTTDYHLFNRNWELDAYTSCLPSPQQGNAPLVGMNVLGEVTIQDPDTGAVTTAQTEVDGEDVSVVVTSPIQSVEHARTLVNLTNSGFSIADLRQTNNLTRFLEQSIRSGYRYVDFIKGQFGHEPKYAELDMPEFLGGFSQRVDVNMISNTNGVNATDDNTSFQSDVLGSYAGQARAFGGSEHGITRYFDDFGFVIGIMCIVPDAAYSQLLPKHYAYNNRLDYYFPLFSEIGLQPVTYEEVCPVQSHHERLLGDNSKHLTDTFGYQRPNHEYVWYPDTIHGQMRLTLKDTLINRVFEQRPELGNDFLVINPDETNNIFSVTEADNDVVIGQIVVKITAKRPIPRIVIPGLGR